MTRLIWGGLPFEIEGLVRSLELASARLRASIEVQQLLSRLWHADPVEASNSIWIAMERLASSVLRREIIFRAQRRTAIYRYLIEFAFTLRHQRFIR